MVLNDVPPKRLLKEKNLLLKKQKNKKIHKIRIKVEHTSSGIKEHRIAKEQFRCHKFGYEDIVIPIACGLYNF